MIRDWYWLSSLKKFYIISLIAILLCFPLLVKGHGGEDHNEETNAPLIIKGQINSRLAKTSTAELLLKYATPVANEETKFTIFITDLLTNEPLANAQIKLKFNFIGHLEDPTANPTAQAIDHRLTNNPPLEIVASSTDRVGIYQASITLPQTGQYRLSVNMVGNEIDAQALIDSFIVSDKTVETPAKIRWDLLIAVSVIVLLLVVSISSYLFSLRSRQFPSHYQNHEESAQ